MIFFLIRREKIEKFEIFRGNFPTPTPSQRWLTRPGSKIFDLDPLILQAYCLDVKVAWFIFQLGEVPSLVMSFLDLVETKPSEMMNVIISFFNSKLSLSKETSQIIAMGFK